MRAGVGFIMIVVATLMKALDVLFHSLLKTPEAVHGNGAEGGGRYRAGKSAIVPDGVDEEPDGYADDDGGWE